MFENKPQPGVSAVLSFVFNGLGQIYNGEIKKGLTVVFLSALGMLMIICGGVFAITWLLKGLFISGIFFVSLAVFILGVIMAAIIGVFSINDAYNTAKRLNK